MADAATLLRQSLADRRAGRLLAARATAEAMVRAHPTDPRAWHMLGLVRRELGHPADAARALDRGLALAPAHAVLLHLRARVQADRGLPAVAHYDRAQAAAPSDAQVALGRAAAILASGDTAAAHRAFEAIVAVHPTDPAAHTALATLRHQLGDAELSLDAFELALARHPANPALWNAYLALLARSRRHARLLASLPRARTALGDGPALARLEATAASEVGDVARADALFAAAAHRGPEWRVPRLRHRLRTRRLDDAAADAEDGWAAGPDPALWPYLAIVWRLTGDPRHAWLEGDPRLVGVYDLAELTAGLPALAALLRRLHTALAAPPDQSLRGGTQTDGHLLLREDAAIVQLRSVLERAIERHIAQLPPPDPRHPQLSMARPTIARLTGSWSVRLAGAGHHVNHVHSEGWFSSAFYVAVPPAVEPAGWLKLGQPPDDLGLDLAPIRLIEPRPGRLVLFPSTLWHGTEPFAAGERLSVAFDVAPLL